MAAIALSISMVAAARQPELPASIWADLDRVRDVLSPTARFDAAEKYELMQGGAGTVKASVNANAYSHHTQTLDFEGLQRFKLGNALFNKFWVSSPASTLASDGLGPFFSARACQSCHIKDGRGQLPQRGEKNASLVLQLKREVAGQWRGDPVYGSQLQPLSVSGVAPEAYVQLRHETTPVMLDDEAVVHLRKPVYQLRQMAYGALADGTVLSARLANAMPGLGLIDAIDARHILAYEDPLDEDGDGVSGRANWQQLPDGRVALGRFGHKASTASVEQQIAHAFRDDMGLSTNLLPTPNGDCTARQRCDELPNGVQPHLGDSEVSEQILQLVTFYSSHLAVPARRDVDDADVLAGKALFYTSGCIACHVPKHVTRRDASIAEHRFQLIWPYSDFLLHDMGPGLADGAGDGRADGREWRTAPLWGIGVAQTVNPRTGFLHDGRATTLLEAVLWHGGEAQAARERVVAMKGAERRALIRFLESL